MLWTPRQRAGLTLLTAILLFILAVRVQQNPAYLSDPQPAQGPRAMELADRIDPNTADWSTLAALPTLGPKMAQRIVEEREVFRAAHPEQLPFARLEDLLRVKGIGRATLQTLEPYLMFPAQDRPAPQP